MRAAGVQGWRYALEVLVVALVLVLICAGCAGLGDEFRVAPARWVELELPALKEMCRDWSAGMRGCVVSRAEGDTIYTLPVVRP